MESRIATVAVLRHTKDSINGAGLMELLEQESPETVQEFDKVGASLIVAQAQLLACFSAPGQALSTASKILKLLKKTESCRDISIALNTGELEPQALRGQSGLCGQNHTLALARHISTVSEPGSLYLGESTFLCTKHTSKLSTGVKQHTFRGIPEVVTIHVAQQLV